ncbi:MAG: DinB family protein [Pseudomonadota bacterium]
MKAHFQRLGRYNAWANTRLYAAAEALSDADYRADCGAFFGSVHGTLNHIMVADLIWAARIRGAPNPPFGLDHILHEDHAELTAARRVLDADLIALTDELDETRIAANFTYCTVTGDRRVTEPLAPALAHLFNHQTHHRGQIHALLTRLTGSAPALDLIFFQRETG